METFLTQQETSELIGISEREVQRRMLRGDYKYREFPSARLRGRMVKKVILETLPWDLQRKYKARQELMHPTPRPLPALPAPAEAPASKTRIASPMQVELPFNQQRGDRLRYLAQPLRGYVEKWLNILGPTDILHWNGLWKDKFYNRVMTVVGKDGEPRQFVISSKTALVEYIAAAHGVSAASVYRRRQELREWQAYLDVCHRQQIAPDSARMEAIFVSRAKDDGLKRLQKRADKGKARSITPEVQQWLLGRFAAGSAPGQDGWRTTLIGAIRELETLREYLEVQGEDPDAAALRVPSHAAVRRFYKTVENDPAITWAQDGSKKFHNQVVPFTPRNYDMFTHDWWVSDHRVSNLWVWLDSDPEIPPFRPWVTWWLDVRSRWPVAFVGALVPSSVTIMRAWKEAILRHHAAPRHAYMDNGKDYLAIVLNGTRDTGNGSTGAVDPRFASNDGLSERELGLFARFGVQVHHALASGRNKRTGETRCHAQSKVVERFFQNLDPFDRSLRGACGEGPQDKPEKLAAELYLHAEAVEKWKAVPSAERPEFESPLMSLSGYLAVLENFLLTGYGQRTHRGEGMDCSPLEAFDKYLPERFGIDRPHITATEVEALMLTPPQKATVKNMMVRVELSGRAQYYQHADFYWLTGKQVLVELDPSDPGTAWVSCDGKFVGRAERVDKLAYGAPAEAIAAREKLKHYVVRVTKERVKQLAAATFLPSQEQLAAMRSAVAQARETGPGTREHGIPYVESLDRGLKRLEASTADANPLRAETSEDVAGDFLKILQGESGND